MTTTLSKVSQSGGFGTGDDLFGFSLNIDGTNEGGATSSYLSSISNGQATSRLTPVAPSFQPATATAPVFSGAPSSPSGMLATTGRFPTVGTLLPTGTMLQLGTTASRAVWESAAISNNRSWTFSRSGMTLAPTVASARSAQISGTSYNVIEGSPGMGLRPSGGQFGTGAFVNTGTNTAPAPPYAMGRSQTPGSGLRSSGWSPGPSTKSTSGLDAVAATRVQTVVQGHTLISTLSHVAIVPTSSMNTFESRISSASVPNSMPKPTSNSGSKASLGSSAIGAGSTTAVASFTGQASRPSEGIPLFLWAVVLVIGFITLLQL
ncbi:hypothetical protein ACLMJK_007686 [Lecanora helva]